MPLKSLTRRVTDHYLISPDFNGLPLGDLVDIDNGRELERLRQMIREGKLEIVSTSWDCNPSIKRLACPPTERQLSCLDRDAGDLICVYPTPRWMHRQRAKTDATRPFTSRLQSAEPQLAWVPFDLAVLERYYRDPRYNLEMYNFGGHITIADEHYHSDQVPARDKIILESFGYGRTRTHHQPVVIAFLRYLSNLTPEHQMHWNGHVIAEQCEIEGNYYRVSVLGDWPESMSIHVAFLEEFKHINNLCSLIGRPPLFRNTFGDERPRGFGLMLRPTRSNYGEFIHLLDKMVSENIDRDFFVGTGIDLYRKIQKQDRSIESQPKSSISLLEEWLKKSVRFRETGLVESLLYPLKVTHRLRHPLAHAMQEDTFDPGYHKAQQRRLIRTYRALQGIRLILSSHPSARTYKLPVFMEEEKIALP